MNSNENGKGSLIVDATNLSKQYGQLVAVDKIELKLSKGELFGLIGPDGAGKTSIFHMLGGILDPSDGTLSVLNMPAREARSHIGYLTQQFSLYPDLSLDQNIRYAGGLRDVSTDELTQRKDHYLELMDLKRFESRLAANLSGGMKQKLALCCALIARPRLLLLDEPTTGVDPVSRRDFWDVLATISAEGMTIAVATPYLDEAERCSRIALIHKGVIRELGTPAELKQHLGLHRLELRGAPLPDIESLIQSSDELRSFVVDTQEFGDRVDILVRDPQAVQQALVNAATNKHIALDQSLQEPTLENVFASTIKQSQPTPQQAPYPFVGSQENKGAAMSAENLSKKFGNFTAVNQVSLSVCYGEIFGLLGANGAGKTTFIKMLCGLLEPTSGKMHLAGKTSNLQDPTLRRKIGYMSQKFTLYEDLTVLENLQFYGGVYQVSDELMNERIRWTINSSDLCGSENMLAKKLPGGFRQRLAFAASVLHQPQILFLDEPTSGVDPIARQQLWSLISDFARHGAAVLVTTHFLEEAEYCHQLGFIASGQLVASGTPKEIKESQPGKLIEIRTSQNQQALDLLRTVLPPWQVSIFGASLHIVVEDAEQERLVTDYLNRKTIQVESQRVIPFSMEDAFIGIVQRNKVSQQ